jgi:hypothetical protein
MVGKAVGEGKGVVVGSDAVGRGKNIGVAGVAVGMARCVSAKAVPTVDMAISIISS